MLLRVNTPIVTHINTDPLITVKRNILAALAYFDMFDYPLTVNEIYIFLGEKHNRIEFAEAINCLLASKTIYQFDKFFSLKNDYLIIIRRNKGNKKASEMIIKAKEVGRFLIKFPYVRGIGISGSLSKNYADDKSDIDLFIITKTNRLWLARTLMHCFKKLTFLINKQHNYCMNYFVDEQQLEIAEKNIYTAIEIETLIPVEGDLVFEKFYAANNWTRRLLPNKTLRVSSARSLKTNPFKNMVEWLFNNKLGNLLDDAFLKITASRWDKKTTSKKLTSRGILMALSVGKHFAKPDPVNFQSSLLKRYQLKLDHLFQHTEERVAQ